MLMFVIEQFDVGLRSAELRRTHGREYHPRRRDGRGWTMTLMETSESCRYPAILHQSFYSKRSRQL